jgi:hypothetical protein
MTLVEAMISVAVMSMVFAGVMSAHFLGLREDRLMESKAGANDTARRSINQMLQDIRGAKGYVIGNMSSSNFRAITNGNLQGGAVQLYSAVLSTNQTIDTSQYVIYYFDTSQVSSGNGKLWCMNSTNTLTPTVVASNLINNMLFTSEDYQGRTQTVRTYKGVVHTTLEFCQFQYPLTAVGSNCLYDYYRIDCRATPHLPDGP